MLIPVDAILHPCDLTVSLDTMLASVFPLMQQQVWPILPIVAGSRLVGSLTASDLVQAIAQTAPGDQQNHAQNQQEYVQVNPSHPPNAQLIGTHLTVTTCLSHAVIPIPRTGQIDVFSIVQQMQLHASLNLLAQDDRGQLLGVISFDRLWHYLGDLIQGTDATLVDVMPSPPLTVAPQTPLHQLAHLMMAHPGQCRVVVTSYHPAENLTEVTTDSRSGEPPVGREYLLGMVTTRNLLQTWFTDPSAVAETAMTALPHPVPCQTSLTTIWDMLQPGQPQAFTVLTETGALAGIIQSLDLLTVFTPRYLYQRNQKLQQQLTEQAQAQAQVKIEHQNTKARLHEITSIISQVFFIRAITGEFLYVSPAYENLWGRSREHLYTYPEDWLNAVHPEDLGIVQASLQAQFKGECDRVDREYRIIQPEGTIRWIRARITSVRGDGGQVLRFIGVAEDITDRKQVELALLEQEQFLRSIYEHVHDGIFVVDVLPDGDLRYISINPAQSQLLGMSTEEFCGQTPEQIFPPEAAAWVRQQYQHCIAVGTSITYEELLPFQGQDYWWKTSLTPLKDNTGRIYRLVGTCANITHLKQTEEALRRSLQEKEILLSEVHHRVKNNLQILSSLLSLQANRIQDKTIYSALVESRNRISTMALIHEHLYQSEDLTHINFFKYVQRLVMSIFSSYAPLAQRVNYDIDISPEASIHLETSVTLGLILNELINNALQHAFPEAVLLPERSRQIGIHLDTNVADSFTLTVWDNGVGLPADFAWENIQSMGLRLVQNLISQLSGHLDIQYRNPTIFKLTFSPI